MIRMCGHLAREVGVLAVLAVLTFGQHATAQEAPPRRETVAGANAGASTSGPVEREVRMGPVMLVLRVKEGEIRVAERFEVELEARTDRDHDLLLSSAPAQLGEMRVVSVRDDAPQRRGDGSLVLIRRMKLEPFLDGEYTIPAMVVTYTSLSEPGGKASVVSTEPVAVRVVSNLSEEERSDASKLDVEAARTILPVPEEAGRSWWWVGVGGVAVGVLGVVVGVWIARRRRGVGSSVLEAALPRIRGIRGAIEADHASRAQVDELMVLTRLCLVERCDARAASLTTEELRRACVEWSALALGESQRLVEAMAACDEARFAGVRSASSLRFSVRAIEEVMERLRFSTVAMPAGSVGLQGEDAAGTAGPHQAKEVA